MKGIFVKPERLEEALNNEGFYLNIFDLPSRDRNRDVFDGIMKSDKPEDEKLNVLLEKGFIFEKEYKLLKRCISYDETIPRKIFVSYPKKFLDKLSVGPITLQEAMYVFCTDGKVLKEYERQRVVGVYYNEHELLGLVKNKMDPHEYGLVKKNIGRKNGKNIS